jgi:flagellar biosynthesis protein FlhF
MLSSRPIAEGVEVIAAIDYDDSLFTPAEQKALLPLAPNDTYPTGLPRDERSPPSPTPLPPLTISPEPETSEYQRIAAALAQPALPTTAPAPPPTRLEPAAPSAATAVPGVARAPQRPAPVQTPPAVAAELKDLRRLLEGQLAGLAWNDVNRRDPARARVLRTSARKRRGR